ncbi:hypothetical protein JRC04_20700 [Mycolicibacterium sp. S2-37]|uniref:hypothetical protein n=1 Tax=Mycolicibacterium sp. S2-37 TaxID=2810297 RepID=UPI001A94D05F|nr:hypothetical protein [Mycolicibacterium sp. S2-37]MBO0679895.1 hypothetical protein [Mycolicibacterium sp. S2-37]
MAAREVEDALDRLYAAAPEDFTALRSELSAAAKKRGDTAAAKQIAAARKPTVSASVVNRLFHGDPAAAARIADVGERLRSAHAEMDGEQIRALSAEQRKLVGELTRAAITAAGIANPSAALRDDVTDTLQAAVADPDVAARLGRLVKAEQWSGFGGFGDTTEVTSRKAPAKAPGKKAPGTKAPGKAGTERAPDPPHSGPPKRDDAAEKAAEKKRARAVLAAAERAKAEADAVTAQRQSDLATARLRHQDARDRLAKAEQALRDTEDAYEEAKKAGREAAEVVRAAKGRHG